MGLVSIRFTEPEEVIVNKLSKYYHEDRSKILKRSIIELYEDLVDKMEIEAFVKKENIKKGKLYSADDVLKELDLAPAHPVKKKKKNAGHFN